MVKYLLAIVLAVACGQVLADGMIELRGGGYLRLTLQPCTHEVVTAIILFGDDKPEEYKRGVGVLNGKPLEACWQPAPGGAFIVDQEGDMGVVPQSSIKVAP